LFDPVIIPLTFHWKLGALPPLTGVAVKSTVEPVQMVVAEAAIEILTGNNGFTVTVSSLEVAGLPDVHVAFEVRTQVTLSLSAGTKVNTGLLLPSLTPFTFQRYTGALPPFTGAAVYVICEPEHTVPERVLIDMLTGSSGLTIMVTELEFAGFPDAQVALEVSTQVTASLFAGV